MEHKCLKCGLIAEQQWADPIIEEQEVVSIRDTGYCLDCRLEELEKENN